MRVLVTGGAGFIGSWVVDALLARPDVEAVLSFDCLDRQVHPQSPNWPPYQFAADPAAWESVPNPSGPPSPSRARCWFGDVRDPNAVLSALLDFRPDVVIHLAALVGVGQSNHLPARYVSANVTGTAVVCEQVASYNDLTTQREGLLASMADRPEPEDDEARAALEAADAALRMEIETLPATPVRALVIAGSMSSYGEGEVGGVREDRELRPASVYAWTKAAQEDVALMVGRMRGLDVRIARFFNVIGERQSLTNPYTGIGAIFAARCLAGLAPRIYEDGGQTRDFIHVSDVAQAVLAIVDRGRSGDAYNVGTGEGTTVLRLANRIRNELEAMGHPSPEPEVTGLYRAGDVRRCVADSWALRGLGWEPKLRVDDTIGRLCAWVAAQPADVRAKILESTDLAHDALLEAGLLVAVESEGGAA